MSKDKKDDKNLLSDFDLEDFLEDRLENYLDDYEESFFDLSYADNLKFNPAHASFDAPDPPNYTKSEKDTEFYNALMKLYVKDLEALVKDSKPRHYQVISGSGPAWFFEPLTRQFVKTERGLEVAVIQGEEDEMGRYLVRTMNTFIMVPKDEILDLGYN
jgi:hypothetical protein